MSIANKFKKFFSNPWRIFYRFNYTKVSHLLSDKMLIKLIFKARLGYRLDLKNPKTFNEKLQWLKLNNRNPLYTKLVDKYEVKRYVTNLVGEKYIIPTIGVWNSFEEIDFDILPDKFVLKCTHDSGSVVICKDKNTFDKKAAYEKFSKALKNNFFYRGREWPYKNVKPRIIAEEYIEDFETGEARDYKFFCFDGEMKTMFIATDRQTAVKFDFFDKDFNHLQIVNGHPNSNAFIKKPESFDEMIQISEKLSKGIPHVRVDLYEINHKIYFGELTFFHYSGFTCFKPEIWDEKFGELIDLPNRK